MRCHHTGKRSDVLFYVTALRMIASIAARCPAPGIPNSPANDGCLAPIVSAPPHAGFGTLDIQWPASIFGAATTQLLVALVERTDAPTDANCLHGFSDVHDADGATDILSATVDNSGSWTWLVPNRNYDPGTVQYGNFDIHDHLHAFSSLPNTRR